MKKTVCFLLTLCMLCSACLVGYADETCTASARGFGGDVTVELTVENGVITGASVTGANETPAIGGAALEKLAQQLIEAGSADIEGVSGATLTSNAAKEAAAEAFAAATAPADAPVETVAAEAKMVPGTYTATMHGHHSDVVVETVVSEGAIESVTVVSEGETYNLSDAAINTIPAAIVENQSILVDAVSCATLTSYAITGAVTDCIRQAGGDEAVKAFKKAVVKPEIVKTEETLSADVVVVGAGITGLAAATKAQQAGANVILLEKNSFFGGISQTAFGGMVVPLEDEAETHSVYNYLMQKPAGIIKGAEYLDNGMYPVESLVTTYLDTAPAMLQWLDDLGIARSPVGPRPIDGWMVGGAIFLYADAPDNMGMASEAFANKFVEMGGTLCLSTEATSLIFEDGKVTGVKASSETADYTISAKSVVLATGGYGANVEMLEEYCPAFANDINVTLPSNVGDGIRMALEVGAVMWDDQFCMSGSGHLEMTDADRISGYHDCVASLASVYVSPNGLRLNSEDPSPYTLGATFSNPDGQDYYWIINNKAVAEEGGYVDLLDNHVANGDAGYFKADSIAELARQIKITPNVLRYTMNRYNAMAVNGCDEDCGKDPQYMVPMTEGPWYAAKAEIVMFGTVGGIITNENAEVVDAEGNAIPGLFAAGEVSNHGLNNLCYSQNQLGECLVYGMIAGENAAK